MSFTHLHLHSEFSLLDGAIKVNDLCKRAVELGQTSVAITDHGWIASAVKFVQAAKDAGIKPIIGMETYLASGGDHKASAKSSGDNYHLTLLAKNKAGYQNLMRLTSLAHVEGFSYKPRIDRALLAQYAEGVIVLSGCIGAEIPQMIIEHGEVAGLRLAQQYQKSHGDNFFVEVMAHGAVGGIDHVRVERDGVIELTETQLNEALVNIANKIGAGIVATNDAHYLRREHGQHHDTLLCIGMGAWKDKTDRMRFPGANVASWEFYVKSESEMRATSSEAWWETACANTCIVADMCEADVVPLGANTMPSFRIPDDPAFEAWLTRQETK